ncbi:UBA/THIF-type NAD/FAD binding protein [Nitzschia inconspicua]|uniref:NEDD8-activating enzyme E1 regulatory subunit n=1 Tax=Nitzschia inconspicua TaxID=303405 RepID=A0A9K3LBV0_9STRA|nr:UBA/THIF-type NAD/FAD binding protein [Nitzschia inconspicua]
MATDNKYDRQLRLWGAKGQQALGDTHVILVGASAAGTETLKNLVLPGIGSFVVVDSGTVTSQDASSNFFLPQSAVGNSKAETACQFLQELNPDVNGSHQTLIGTAMPTTEEGWKSVLEPQIFKSKNCLLIAADVPPMCLESLADFCYHSQTNLPMLVVRSYGLMGCVRLQLPPRGMALLEPKPTNAPPDLRLVNSFPAFVQLADSIDLTTLDSQQHGHVPYPILLYKAAQTYRQKNDNKLPSSFTEKQDFKTNYLQAMSRDLDKELNFQEAVANAYLAYTERDLTTHDNLDDGTSKLTCLYKALAIFLKEYSNGRPPLNGSIPDMTASTELYVKLQTIYKEQAEKDVQTMTEIVSNLNLPQTIDQDDIASFCANVYAVGQMSTRSILQELDSTSSGSDMVDEWKMTLMDPYEVPVHTPLLWYLGLQACHLFCKQEGRHPGIVDNEADWKTDVPTLTAIYQQQILPLYQLTDQTSDDMLLNPTNVSKICEELTRYGNAEVHAVASVVGGVASQEAVKIITGQYIPVDNTYIYNGIVSVGGVYKF